MAGEEKPEAVTLSDVEMQMSEAKAVTAELSVISDVAEAVLGDLETIALAVRVTDLRALARVPKKRNIPDDVLRALLERVLPKSETLKAVLLENLEVVFVPPAEHAEERARCLEKFLKAKEKAFTQLCGKPTGDDCDEKSPPIPTETVFYFGLQVLHRVAGVGGSGGEAKRRFQVLASQLMSCAAQVNLRTMDTFAAPVYKMVARAFDDSEKIRNDLLAVYRTACLRQDFQQQAVLINVILRNFTKAKLYEQGSVFASKMTFPTGNYGVPNAELARYLYYLGRTRAVQLSYSQAHSNLMQAIRKSPQNKALGFRANAWQFALVVELLMGEIPGRSTFLQPDLRPYLIPYEAITKAVYAGTLTAFETALEKYKARFEHDETLTLVTRLRYNVIKTGLRKLNLSYSRISIADICVKLGYTGAGGNTSQEDVEAEITGICAKAIADGVIHGTIDYEKGLLVSKGARDLYSGKEPSVQLHKRIAFLLDMHNDTVRAMEYPSKKDLGVGGVDPSEVNREIQELVEESEEDDDIDML